MKTVARIGRWYVVQLSSGYMLFLDGCGRPHVERQTKRSILNWLNRFAKSSGDINTESK